MTEDQEGVVVMEKPKQAKTEHKELWKGNAAPVPDCWF